MESGRWTIEAVTTSDTVTLAVIQVMHTKSLSGLSRLQKACLLEKAPCKHVNSFIVCYRIQEVIALVS